jgi:hypothetical protein
VTERHSNGTTFVYTGTFTRSGSGFTFTTNSVTTDFGSGAVYSSNIDGTMASANNGTGTERFTKTTSPTCSDSFSETYTKG